MTTPQTRKRTPRDPRLVALPDEFLLCRADRHDLPPLSQPTEAQRWRYPDAKVIELWYECRRCGSVQVRKINEADGSLYRPTGYRYTDGYLTRSDEGRGSRILPAAARLEAVRRWLTANPLPVTAHG